MSTTASAIMVEALASYGDIGIAAVKHIAELERENAALREALKPFAAQTLASSLTEEKMIRAARAALKGEAT
jgi:hypothetical protein